MRQLKFWTRVLLFVSTLTPLVVVSFAPFPFVFGKMIFLRSLAGIVAALSSLYFLMEARRRGWVIGLGRLRNPLFVAVIIFMLSAAVSTALAPNSYRGFFGEIERAEGLYGLLTYSIFFVVALFLFEPKHWKTYFRLGIIVGALTIGYALIQYEGFKSLPFTSAIAKPPGSLLGNPGALASFLILLLAYALLVYRDSKGFWKYLALVVGLTGLGTIALLEVRGAMIGLAAGAFIFLVGKAVSRGEARLRWIGFWLSSQAVARALLALFLFLIILMWTSRESPVWQSLPVFNRIMPFSYQSVSVQTRILSIGVSWNAFKERPLFGWGLENYSVAYNKHYNPAYAIYAEDWFDRAHNKILDVLVMQGVVGLASYMGIFAAFFYVLRKTKELKVVRLLLGAIIAAYFVQNLFTFDHINSYLPFFAIISFCASCYQGEPRKEILRGERWRLEGRPALHAQAWQTGAFVLPKLGRWLLGGGASVFMLGVLYSLVAWNFIPLYQAWNQMRLVSGKQAIESIVERSRRFLRPYNFVQKDLRTRFTQLTLATRYPENNQFQAFSRQVLAALEEVAVSEPYDPRLMIRLAEAYNQLAKDNREFFEKSVKFIEKARSLSPRRQTILGLEAIILGGAAQNAQSIKLARETLALEPRAAKSHYWLGMALALSLKDSPRVEQEKLERIKEEALQELGIAVGIAREQGAKGNYYLFFESDFQNIMTAYQNLEADGDLAETIRVAQIFYPSNLYFYRSGMFTARARRDAAEVIRNAERIRELYPNLRDDMEVIIDLARKENWEIMDTL